MKKRNIYLTVIAISLATVAALTLYTPSAPNKFAGLMVILILTTTFRSTVRNYKS